MTQKEKNRRYKLHQKIKAKYRYEAQKKTVYVPHDDDLDNKDLKELTTKFNYNIQFEIT
ncbi:MAG: hypothetical protein JNM71_12635 [Flavobacterium lindanitolerans]|uniref:hypothetical protein n=1 Tax=Flavobacterium lindanitolerans TaxID=428988 RepID=UPI001A38D3A1|nr:hypothetical protein [Flavobacterium lindanitolerans]MBL7868853.1 hypothetical protein [Flavobacterium lindanitolerans]